MSDKIILSKNNGYNLILEFKESYYNEYLKITECKARIYSEEIESKGCNLFQMMGENNE